jgi:chromate reductase, NAD(P)H dehydrogenase (quinone)
MTPKPLPLLGIAGSLRKASKSRALLEAMQELLPEGVALESFPLDEVPMYNADLEGEARPPGVCALRAALERSKGLVLVAPEYNHSIPGVLKNALDWASRPAYRSPLLGMPVVGVGLSGGLIGGARGLQHLKLVLSSTGSELYPGPEALVGKAGEKIDDGGRLVDAGTREFLSSMLAGFVAWATARSSA